MSANLDDFAPENIPATVQYFPPKRVALVTHPAGQQHENVRLTKSRLRHRGLRILDVAPLGAPLGRAERSTAPFKTEG